MLEDLEIKYICKFKGDLSNMMLLSIDFIKALACLLIVNFHCLYIYPTSLQSLRFGGDLGNNIFFLVSGFTLFPSIQNQEFKNMGSWIKKRYIRIIPLSFAFNMISFVTYPRNLLPGGIFKCFVFPMVYWFVGAIFIFYPILFCVEKINSKQCIYIIIAMLLGLHVVFDSLYAERYIMGLVAMIIGAELRKKYLFENNLDITIDRYAIGTGVLFAIFCFFKIIYGKGIGPRRLEHLTIGILTVLIASCLLLTLLYQEKKLQKLEDNVKNLIKFLSRLTLSSYLCQQLINVIAIDFFKSFIFPISIILYLTFVFGISYVVERIDFYIKKLIL